MGTAVVRHHGADQLNSSQAMPALGRTSLKWILMSDGATQEKHGSLMDLCRARAACATMSRLHV